MQLQTRYLLALAAVVLVTASGTTFTAVAAADDAFTGSKSMDAGTGDAKPLVDAAETSGSDKKHSAGAAKASDSDKTHCAESDQPSKPGEIDPKADKVLHELSDFYKNLKSMSVDLHAVMTVESPGKRTEVPSDYKVLLEKPNRFRISSTSGRREGVAVSDGTASEFYTSTPAEAYMTTTAPTTIADVFDRPEFVLATRGWLTMAFLEPLVVKDPYDDIIEGVTKIEYLGEDKVDDVQCHHLKLTQPKFICDFWVQEGAQPLMKKVSPDLSAVVEKVGEQAPALENARVSMSFVYKNFVADAPLKDSDLKNVHPPTAKKIGNFFEQPKHPLEGKPAPDVSLALLDGGEVKLSSLKDKVVVLDFWATWCGPCIHSLPVLTQVLSEQKGVEFYAINQKESRERIHKFLADTGLSLPVALDSDGKIGDKFGVDGIPQTVIIGRDGLIKVVHVGYSPMLKQILAKELSAIVEEK